MRISKIYLDTSVFGGYFDTEFSTDTKPFFEKIISENIKIVVSETLETEIYKAPSFYIGRNKNTKRNF